jgi:hypothetical protein
MAKHAYDVLRSKPTEKRSSAQTDFVAEFHEPEWLVQYLNDEARRHGRPAYQPNAPVASTTATTQIADTPLYAPASPPLPADPAIVSVSASTTHPSTIPDWTAPIAEWIAYDLLHPEFSPSGVSRLDNGDPNPLHLDGFRILRPLLARPASAHEESRDKLVDQLEKVVPLFTTRAENDQLAYVAKLNDLNVQPDPIFAPKPFGSAANLNQDEFVRFAAGCGLTAERAEGPVRAFCLEWRRIHSKNPTARMDVD